MCWYAVYVSMYALSMNCDLLRVMCLLFGMCSLGVSCSGVMLGGIY